MTTPPQRTERERALELVVAQLLHALRLARGILNRDHQMTAAAERVINNALNRDHDPK